MRHTRDSAMVAFQTLAESADVLARLSANKPVLAAWTAAFLEATFVFDPVTAALPAQVLAPQVSGQGIEQAGEGVLHWTYTRAADPAGRSVWNLA